MHMEERKMRTIDGHFTIINEPGTARALATNLLGMFESVRAPEHIIITEALLDQGATRAQAVLSNTLGQSIVKVEAEIEAMDTPDDKVMFPKIDKAQSLVLEATNRAERASTKRHWRKLDKARKALAKQLDKSGFSSYTTYADFINAQSMGGAQRRELFLARDELIARKKNADNSDKSLSSLTPEQIITVLADLLARAPRTQVGPLPIIIDDALRNLDVATKLRALEVLKAHSSHYATWYVTDDPLVLGWAGFIENNNSMHSQSSPAIYDNEPDIAS